MNHSIGDLLYAFFHGDTDVPMIGIIVGIIHEHNVVKLRYQVRWSLTGDDIYSVMDNVYNYEEEKIVTFKQNLEFFKTNNL